ncbi:hypothetical protein MUA21_11840 [Staphylococcus ureilyticus]|nr:hypothetical protein [Staphylococcus ureilyticus]UXS59779.1 hypothetical protein MUA21_11840 [Staphylococcus ureilyticus]
MKKMVTATIATLSLGAIGIAQGEAHASENNQSNTQYTSNQSYSDIFNYGYIDQDDNGNYHHTLDGNWDQSMFDQQQYYFYLIDDEGNYHYYYFPMNNQSANNTSNNTSNVDNVNVSDDNNYTDDQSHEEVQSEGYDINQTSENDDVDNSATTNHGTESGQTVQSNSNNVNHTQNNASTNNNYEQVTHKIMVRIMCNKTLHQVMIQHHNNKLHHNKTLHNQK